MPVTQVIIDSVLGGIAPNLYRGAPGQFSSSIGIDPDQPINTTSAIKTSGVLVPSAYTNLAGALLTNYLYWLLTNPKDENLYAVQADGKLLSYNSSLASETHFNNTFTVTIASPGVFSLTAHGFAANDRIRLFTTGALPTGLSTNTTYYVISAGLTADAFQVSATEGGSAINTSGSQSGTHRLCVENGGGAAYYNNYLYIAQNYDISRYGPLDGTPTLTHGVWRGTTLGSLAALKNATYPSQRSVTLPNHPMYVHVDNKLYFGDFSTAEANGGRGLIHVINTKRVTNEGDTNNSSARSVLALPYGYAPTAISSWGNDLVIAAIPMSATGIGNTLAQGKAALFFWDAVNAPALPYKMVTLIDPVVTALLNHNGNLFVWSGNMNNGVRVSLYEGGYKLKQLAFFEEGFSPPAGAVDGLGNRIAWGAFTTYPENSASVYSLGYKDGNLPLALHNIIKTNASASASAGMVTALKAGQHASFIAPRFLVGWRDASSFGIDRLGSTAGVAVYRSLIYNVGKPFKIKKVVISLSAAIAANMTLIPTIYVDDESTGTALTTINSTNYAANQLRIVFYPTVSGNNNFNIQLRWSGTTVLAVTLPILIEVETLPDATG